MKRHGCSQRTEGSQYSGADADDYAGSVVAGIGDVDFDGHADIAIGAYGDRSSGACFVVFGSGAPASFELSSADATLTGEASGDLAGWSAAGAGDVDADGYDDLLVGAYAHDDSGTDEGAAYLLLGGSL